MKSRILPLELRASETGENNNDFIYFWQTLGLYFKKSLIAQFLIVGY